MRAQNIRECESSRDLELKLLAASAALAEEKMRGGLTKQHYGTFIERLRAQLGDSQKERRRETQVSQQAGQPLLLQLLFK